MSQFTEDKIIFETIEKELHRQQQGIELIASENFVSEGVLRAQGSILTNKYAEGLNIGIFCTKQFFYTINR